MHWFYIFSIVPVAVGFVLWLKNKRVVWWEWLLMSVFGFCLSGVMHYVAYKGMTADTETWSGQITHARHYSAWTEYYEEAIYRTEYYWTTETRTRTVGSGKNSRTESYTVRVQRSRQVFDHWEPRTRHHSNSYKSFSNIDTDYSIAQEKYQYFVRMFQNESPVAGVRRTSEHNSRMIAGDPNDYVSRNVSGWIEPVTKLVAFENRIKAAPSVFSFVKVGTNVPVNPYPPNNNPFVSDRLIGDARGRINQLKFDQMNAELGPKKHVNVIIVGFKSADSSLGEFQRALWLNGKKNDLVVCYGVGENDKTLWVKVFGWSESDICKRNIESIFLKNQINNDILPLLADEIKKGYVIKDWSKFDYISIEPKTVHFVWYWVIMLVAQAGLIWFSLANEESKNQIKYGRQRHKYV